MYLPEQDLLKIEETLFTLSQRDERAEAALALIRKAKDARADPALIEQGRDLWLYSTKGAFNEEDLEIDDDAGTSPTDDGGTWIQAWFWIPPEEEGGDADVS